jgi:thiosulfate/3-mercaptopyruvate sulfurtransferase
MWRQLSGLLMVLGVSVGPARAAEVWVHAAEVPALLAQGAVLLDAREPWRFRDEGHVPGARNAPWQAFTPRRDSGLLRSVAELQAELQRLGVRRDRPVVVYARWDQGWGEEGRLFWMLEYLGHPAVRVVRGGVAAFDGPRAHGEPPAATPGDFVARPLAARRATTTALAERATAVTLLDTRTAEEFAGATLHGEARGGRLPGARHLHWKDLFEPGGSADAPPALKSRSALAALFAAHGVTTERPTVAYCTGGIRSGFVYLVLRGLDHPQVANYDGSFWAWAADPALPVER